MPKLRTFFPKGTTAKVFAKENDLDYLDDYINATVYVICKQTLVERFKKLPEAEELSSTFLTEVSFKDIEDNFKRKQNRFLGRKHTEILYLVERPEEG